MHKIEIPIRQSCLAHIYYIPSVNHSQIKVFRKFKPKHIICLINTTICTDFILVYTVLLYIWDEKFKRSAAEWESSRRNKVEKKEQIYIKVRNYCFSAFRHNAWELYYFIIRYIQTKCISSTILYRFMHNYKDYR